MNRLLTFVGSVVGGYAGWWLGELAGFGFLACFVLSGVAGIAGVVAGWWLARRLS